MFRTPAIKIIDRPADGHHFTPGRPGAPRIIVLHGTGGTWSGDWLTKTSTPPVSVHRLIERDGTTYKLVDDRDTAWGCGPSIMGPYYPTSTLGSLNGWALQLEVESENKQGSFYPPNQIQATALQLAEWLMIWGTLPILPHFMIDEHKHDPVDFPYDELWRRIMAYWV